MSALGNQRLAAKVCEMYYLMDLSQKEISARLGISRPQICRIISQARESGLIEIRIHNPYSDESHLERSLISHYQMKDAVVIRTMGASSEERLSQFSREAASYLDTYLSGASMLGVMSGKTIAYISRHMQSKGRRLSCVVPLVGGIGSDNADLHANAVAMHIAREYNADSLVLNAPLMVSSPEAANILRQEASIADVLDKGRRCDVALVGIGNLDAHSAPVRAGGMQLGDIATLQSNGAVCSICNSYFDADGSEVDVLAPRSIGLSLGELKRGKVIACALGKSKVHSIRAALQTRRVDVLMTDVETASLLLDASPSP